MSLELENIVRIVEKVLGHPRRSGMDYNQWTEYNCRHCADIDGVESDGKYNLCVLYSEGVYHCWKCGEKGRLSKLIKLYGGEKLLSEYYHEVDTIRKSKQYRFDFLNKEENGIVNDCLEEDKKIQLPEHFKTFDYPTKSSIQAMQYLKDRGLNEYFIKKYKIGYVGWSDNYKYRNRIVIPSYDSYGEMNYWIARDFSGKSKLKYCNPQVEKKMFVFNEGLVNWYEDVTLVEGVFDHMVIPNSIPLLGKVLDGESMTYQVVKQNAMANINIFLDDDAEKDALKMYKFLNNGKLKNRIKVIKCPKGYDASLVYQKYGRRGIMKLMRQAQKVDEFDLINI